MISTFAKPPRTKTPVYRQIGDQIRNAILDGHLASGTRIPPALEMARLFESSVCTVQAALAPLVKEGLLERRQKIGTFVTNRTGTLGPIGLYFGSDFWTRQEMGFYRELQLELSRELRSQGGIPKLWMDTRPAAQQTEPLPEIKKAIKKRQIQGLIVGISNTVDAQWISQLKIPVSIFAAVNLPGSVWIDMKQYFELAFQELQRQGCRTAGIIFPLPIHMVLRAGEDKKFFTDLPASAARYGLRLDDAWVRIPATELTDDDLENFGYHEFKRIWASPSRPEGILVFPDVAARGVVTAILEAGVQVPADLKLVLHRNEGMPFHNPLPVTWVVGSVRQIALMLVEQIRRQLNGTVVRPIRIPMAIETF